MTDRSSARPLASRPSSWRSFWPTLALLLLLAAVAFVVLIATEQIEVRFARPASPKTPLLTGPRVGLVEDASKYFEIMGWEAAVYEYCGGFVDCWIEVEIDGEGPLMQELSGAGLGATVSEAPRPEAVRGNILLLRRTDGSPDEGEHTEKCDLHMTASWKQEQRDTQAGVSLRDYSLPKFKQPGSRCGYSGGRRPGGSLHPGEDLLLYEKWETCRSEPGEDVSKRVLRLKCRLTPAESSGPESLNERGRPTPVESRTDPS